MQKCSMLLKLKLPGRLNPFSLDYEIQWNIHFQVVCYV